MTNKVTGLRPMGDRPRSARRNPARVDSPSGSDIRMPGLRPTARPVDTYSRPQAPSQDNSFLQLARALGEINPAISGFLDQEAARQRKDAEDHALRRIGGMSYAEARAAVDAGMPEMDNPWFKAAFMKVMGERTAYNRMNELSAQYAMDPNRHEIDFSSYVRNAADSDLSAYDDPHFNSGYLPIMGNYEANGASKHVEVQTERTMAEAQANVFGVFLGQAQTLTAEGKHPDQIAAELYARYDGQEEFLRLSRGQQDELMMNVIDTLANDGNWEVVKALLNHQREDEFGNMSSLATSPQYAVKTAGIVKRSKDAHGEKMLERSLVSMADLNMAASNGTLTAEELTAFAEANPHMLTMDTRISLLTRSLHAKEQAGVQIAKAELEAQQKLAGEQAVAEVRQLNMGAVNDGSVVFMRPIEVADGKGGTKMLSISDQEDMLAEDLSAAVKTMGEDAGADPAAILNTEIKLFATAGIQNPRWAEVFTKGQSQAIPANLKQFLDDGTAILPPGLEAAIPLFEELSINAPGLLKGYFSDEVAYDFFRTVVDAKKYTGADNASAVRQAITAQINGPSSSSQVSMTSEQVASTLNDLRIGGGWWGFRAEEAANVGHAETFINNAIKHYAAGGFVGEKARQAAVERFKQDFIDINGFYVNVAGVNIGSREQFSHAVDLVFSEILSDQPRYFNGQQLHAEDLSIQPTTGGNGEWMVVSKTGYGMGFPLADIPPFNLNNMAAALQKEADVRAAEIEFQQRQSQYQQEGVQAEKLETLIASMERINSQEHLQRAYLNRWGEGGREYLTSLPARISEHKATLEQLRAAQTLYLLEERQKLQGAPQPRADLIGVPSAE